ncbi:hypothetical protein [Marinobacterium arenosum]|uniref:hypothetical protein n=1 Tax=Marinobacterium arenosum TaxID=2862496 RepID=UPI001C93FC71|nr:hypothetical protein [Marinobacterium arenosum]MBY4676352.1 hypothetical protein [Marinobacterium arenosum]
MDPLILFLITGFVSMSAALSAGAINKLPDESKPAFAQTRNGMVTVVMAGNLAALTLVGAMAYGFLKLDWWIPLLCMFLTFPVVHLLFLQRLLGEVRSLMLMMPFVLAAIGALYYYW